MMAASTGVPYFLPKTGAGWGPMGPAWTAWPTTGAAWATRGAAWATTWGGGGA